MPTKRTQARLIAGFFMGERMTLAIIILAAVLVGVGGGWGVKHWKDGAEIAQVNSEKSALESQNSILQTANSDCATDIQDVKKQVQIIVTLAEEREKAASDAMKTADLLIAQRKKQIRTTRVYQPVAPTPEAQCAAIIREQIDYVQGRRDAN